MKMTRPRGAQDRLRDLERMEAPVEEQIHQAALFSGCALVNPNVSNSTNESADYFQKSGVLHGRQEYVLRWLLKKLQVQEIRQCPESWSLFTLLAGSVPVRNVARMLSERNFVILLRQAVEEAVERRPRSHHTAVEKEQDDESSDTVGASPLEHRAGGTISMKRKRNGQPSENARRSNNKDDAWITAVYKSVKSLLRLTELGLSPAQTFISEHIKSAIRTTSEEAAKLLGGWLSLCHSLETTWTMDEVLSPFIDIWNSRTRRDEDVTQFSEHCLQPCLSVLCTDGLLPKPKAQVEQLLAQHVIIPMKKAFTSSTARNMAPLEALVGESVSERPLFAPILFDVAIRCLQPHNPRPRRSEDSAWLQSVFNTINQSMAGSSSDLRITATVQMLKISINHNVVLDLPFLQLITAQYGLSTEQTSWDIIATGIELDANVFLVPQVPNNLSKELLSRITETCAEPSWPVVADKVVGGILIPLIDAFARARQLGLFIRLWYEQLVAFESLRQSEPMEFTFHCAWEDEALQLKLTDLLEASMTNLQIAETVGWLEERMTECEGAALVVIEAIAGALSRENTTAVFSPKVFCLYAKVSNLDLRYRPRIWRLAKASLRWPVAENVNRSEMDIHLSDRLRDLMTSGQSNLDSFLSLEMLEICRYLCALWSCGGSGLSKEAAIPILNYQIDGLATVVNKLAQDIKTGQALGETRWGTKIVSLRRDVGWFACAYIHCILIEYPKILELFPELPNSAGLTILRETIWIASATTSFSADHSPSIWLRINYGILPGIWMTMLRDEFCLNNSTISRQIIEAMLHCKSHEDNPVVKSPACNGFVIEYLHQVPLEVLSKDDRMAILKSWRPESQDLPRDNAATLSYCMASLDPAVLSLKARMMQRPALYDGIKFQELVDLAHHIAIIDREPQILVPIFGKLAQLTLSQVVESINQPKRQEYFHGMIGALKEWLGTNRRAKNPPSYTMISLMQEVIVLLSNRFVLLNSLGILSKEDLAKMRASFVDLLLLNLRLCFEKPEELKGTSSLFLFGAMDTLDAIMDGDTTRPLFLTDPQAMITSLKQSYPQLGQRLDTFMTQHYPGSLGRSCSNLLDGDISSTSGRNAIQKKAEDVSMRLEGLARLNLVISLIEESVAPHILDKLLALRHVISTCEDLKPVKMDDNEGTSPSLSSAFTLLAARLRKSKGVREFCLVGEMMEMMIRTKPRSITQHNIDDTLSTITILCTRHAPSLRPSHCGTIYSHLIRLARTILTSHRLTIQGHFHLVVQALISLLRCLFNPSASGSRKFSHPGSAPPLPPWLSPPSPVEDRKAHYLAPKHAQSYSRLLTLLCDPSPSRTSRSSQPSLHSSTKLAKQSAGLHVGIVLLAHVRWTLDMSLRMRLEVREALVPGWWVVLEAMGPSGRRLAEERMDSSGRVVLAGLVRDWRMFGEWKG